MTQLDGLEDTVVNLIDLTSTPFHTVTTIGAPTEPEPLKVSPDGKYLAEPPPSCDPPSAAPPSPRPAVQPSTAAPQPTAKPHPQDPPRHLAAEADDYAILHPKRA